MKTTVLFLLLVLAVSPVYAVSTNVEPKDYSGDCGSVGSGDKAGVKPDEINIISGPYNPSGNPLYPSTYGAEGGTPPYSWESSCGSMDSDGKLTGISDCCGTGTVSVTDVNNLPPDQRGVAYPGRSHAENYVLEYNLRFYPFTMLGRGCTEVQGTKVVNQLFFCTSGTLSPGATDYNGDTIPPVSAQCAIDQCNNLNQNARAMQLSHYELVCGAAE